MHLDGLSDLDEIECGSDPLDKLDVALEKRRKAASKPSNPFASLFDRVEQLEELMFKAKRVTKQGLTKRIEYLENRI